MYEGAAPGAGIVTGIGVVHGREVHDRRQRRHRQRRHLLSDDGEEASARAGNRARKPPALRLSRRLGRRVSSDASRGFSGPRALRPHFLQPGADVRARDPADRRRHGLLHRGRRLRSGDVRRDDHRAQPGHDFSGRPAPRQSRDRRNRHRRRARRRRRALAHERRHRSPGRKRRARARDRARYRRQPESQARRRAIERITPEDPLYDPEELAGIIPTDLRKPFDIREVIARTVDGSRFHEFKSLYGTTLVTRLRAHLGLPRRHHRQ